MMSFTSASRRGALVLLCVSLAACNSETLPGNMGGGGPGNIGAPCDTVGDCSRGDGAVLSCCLGVCTDTSIDPRHCGACGMGCPAFANTLTTVCTAATCTVGVCAPGFANCDGAVHNGCEVDLKNDNANCGRCGGLCGPGPHSSAACAASVCVVTCEPPFADCNRAVIDGCEADVTSDVVNCGRCGLVCPAPVNAVASCAAGQCGVGACSPGFGNCDQLPDNGCEANIHSDLQNCGRCGSVCGPVANAAATCSMGACTVRCDPGFADCNNNLADGCETNVRTDARNCGICGRVCPANQFCINGGNCGGFYAPVGPQRNVPVANLVGWSQCFLDLYNDAMPTTAQILAACPRAKLMLACRKTGDPTLALLAWAPRADVLSPSNVMICGPPFVPHQANGAGWYFDGNISWGFAGGGETVSLCGCDTGNSNQRLCWHTMGGKLDGGYRCGATIELNASAAWERVIYQAD